MRTRLLLLLLAGAVLAGFTPTLANAAGTGSISGTVTSDGSPVADNCVRAYSTGAGETQVSFDWTDAGGEYTLEGLETGSYKVHFENCDRNVIEEWYEDGDSYDDATPVPVTDGYETPDIDASLAKGGSVSGTVINGAGPDGGTCVTAESITGHWYGSGRTASDGSYSVNGLKSGNYRIRFQRCSSFENVVSEFYPDKSKFEEGTAVAVTQGVDTPGIDAELEAGGSISGTVIPQPMAAEACALRVEAFDSVGDQADILNVSYSPETPVPFTIDGLRTGEYRLSISQSCLLLYPSWKTIEVGEYFRDADYLSEALPIPVAAGSAVGGVDVNIGSPDPVFTLPEDTILEPDLKRAAISKVRVKGPARIKRGKRVTFRVRITNSGEARATGVRLRVKGSGVNLHRRIGSIPARTSRTVKVKLKPRKTGNARLTFRTTSANAGSTSVKRRLRLRN